MNRDTDTKTKTTPRERQLGNALEHVRQLSDSSADISSTHWLCAAAFVGDISALAVAFRD